jgi:tRNA A-37 threonylcarbamoyl transferase component Bud32
MSTDNFKIPYIHIAGSGLKGIAALAVAPGANFSKADWLDSLAHIKRTGGAEKIFKVEGRNSVILKTLPIASRRVDVVIKRHLSSDFARLLLSNIRPAKAILNFKKALKLNSLGINAEYPLAAFTRRASIGLESIYLTLFVPDSLNLHRFAHEKLASLPPRFRRQLALNIATLLASLHKNGLWHRDAKAGNFLVYSAAASPVNAMLIDLDGIKPYWATICKDRSRWRSFVNLAGSLFDAPDVHRTDYLRTLAIYCKLTGLEKTALKQLWRQIAGQVEIKLKKKSLK